jgi:hypothetical protein
MTMPTLLMQRAHDEVMAEDGPIRGVRHPLECQQHTLFHRDPVSALATP